MQPYSLPASLTSLLGTGMMKTVGPRISCTPVEQGHGLGTFCGTRMNSSNTGIFLALCAMIKSLDLSVFFKGQADADEITNTISVVEFFG